MYNVSWSKIHYLLCREYLKHLPVLCPNKAEISIKRLIEIQLVVSFIQFGAIKLFKKLAEND